MISPPVPLAWVIYNPGYCAQFYPNANCQNKGPNNPYTGDYQAAKNPPAPAPARALPMPPGPAAGALTYKQVFERVAAALDNSWIVIPDTFLGIYSAANLPVMGRDAFLCGGVWASIGHSVAAAVGASLGSNQLFMECSTLASVPLWAQHVICSSDDGSVRGSAMHIKKINRGGTRTTYNGSAFTSAADIPQTNPSQGRCRRSLGEVNAGLVGKVWTHRVFPLRENPEIPQTDPAQ